MFSIGNDELKKLKNLGAEATCPNCGKKHPVLYGKTQQPDGSWAETNTLAFVTCPETKQVYLVGVEGKQLNIKEGQNA